MMYDVAARSGEFLVGVPGQPLQQLTSRRLYQLPVVAGGQVYITVVPGLTPIGTETWSGSPGGCLRRLARGVVESMDPGGKALSVISGSDRSLVDSSGQQLRRLPPAVYTWTNDDQLTGLDQTGRLTVYSSRGQVTRTLSISRANPLGALGPHSLIFSGADLSALDISDGKVTTLFSTQAFLARGSPDGRFVALVDTIGQPRLLRLSEGTLTPLQVPGPITGLVWSGDSAWLAIATRLGGLAYRAGDGHVLDLGGLNILAWIQ